MPTELISAAFVRQAKPKSTAYDVRDSRVRGFLLRVHPSGRMAFYAQYARGKRAKLGNADAISVEQARERAKKIIGEAYQGADPMAAVREAKVATFSEFVENLYRPWAEANIRTVEGTLGRLRANFPNLQKKKLAEVTPWLIEKWRAGRLKAGAKVATANRDLDDLKSVLAKAVIWGQLDRNPIAGVKRGRVDTTAKVRYLEKDEENRLRQALDDREERTRQERDRANAWRRERGYKLLPDLRSVPFADHLKPMVILSIGSGMRRGEVFSLTWSDVDLLARRITVQGAKAKSGRTRHIPLNSEVTAALKGWRDQTSGSGFVFPGEGGERLNNVRKSWEAVLEAAGIERFRWHDMRHHFASKLIMASVDLNTVRELLGHSDYAMTLRYAHLAPEHKAAAVEKLVVAR